MAFDPRTMPLRTIAMMGSPGSGKGTQAELLSEKTGFPIFSSGERYREIVASDTSLSKKVAAVIDHGHLMPFWFSAYLFEHELINRNQDEGIIFEGPGRKEEEACLFDEVARWLERPYVALLLSVPKDKVIERIRKRATLESRADDEEEDIATRFSAFEKHTKPAIEFFRSQKKLIQINGDQSKEEVHGDILTSLEEYLRHGAS